MRRVVAREHRGQVGVTRDAAAAVEGHGGGRQAQEREGLHP